MAVFRAQVVFPMFTNIPSDVTTNTFHFTELSPLGLEAAADAITPRLSAFYTNVYGTGREMASYMRPGNAVVHWYDLSAPVPRVPYTLPLNAVISTTTTTLPTEVSCVLSFQGDAESGVPQARRRGRVFLPALTNGVISASAASAYPQFASAFLTVVTAQAEATLLDLGVTGMRWAVWSPTDQAATIVTNGWVDNTPDTQRRRGIDPTSRTLFP